MEMNIYGYKCKKCGQVALNQEILCEPEKMTEDF